jgi:hypothetical protein
MKKAKDVHRLLEEVDLSVNADADKEVLEGILRTSRESTVPVSQEDARTMLTEAALWKFAFWRKAVYLAALLLVVSSWVAVDLRREVTALRNQLELARQDVLPAQPDDSATINLYLREHQDVVARHASLNQAQPEPTQMRVSHDDILYYEFLDGQPETTRPGMIVRGPLFQGEISSPEAPVISNGHTLTLSEAREAAGFALRAPARLHPGYALDQIRSIQDRDALQLLYSNGINSISLFEQPLDGRHRLEPGHFREYAVYRKEGQAGGIILAWRDDALSYVLIGNAAMSQLMDMAHSIGVTR